MATAIMRAVARPLQTRRPRTLKVPSVPVRVPPDKLSENRKRATAFDALKSAQES
jgi:hypothetical protein